MAQRPGRYFTGQGPHWMVPSPTGPGHGEQERPVDDSHAQPRGQINKLVVRRQVQGQGVKSMPRSGPKGPWPGMGMAMAQLETSAPPAKLG